MVGRAYPLQRTRNIGIVAHIDAGKTTATERILYYTKKIHKIGETHEGNSQMDFMDQEKERGITIQSAATTARWGGFENQFENKPYRINIIDTPGHVDFTVEVERALRVLDGAITVLDGAAGVEPQTETVWRQATNFSVPRIVFVNKMDKLGADFQMSVDSLKKRLDVNAKAIQWPIGAEDNFKGVIDLITRKAWFPDNKLGTKWETRPIPDNLKKLVEEKREELIEAVADVDDELMEKYLDEDEISVDTLKAAIRRATINLKFYPVLVGSAYKDKGIQLLLDAVVDYLPSPLEVRPYTAKDPNTDKEVDLKADDKKPFAALAFKIMTDPYVGRLTFLRVYTGSLKSGTYIRNTTRDKRERVGRLLQMHAITRTEIPEVFSGDIAAAIGLKTTSTGDSLTDSDHPLILESMDFPDPVIQMAIEPKTKADQEKMAEALQKLSEEDPSFHSETNSDTGQTLISGMGELHLNVMVERMRREFNVDVNVGTPEVAYREAFTKTVKAQGRYVRQSGGRGQYGDVWIKFSPNEEGKGFEFENAIVGGTVPREYIPSVQQGLKESMESGPLAGYPIVDLKAKLYDGSYHEVDSSEAAFKIAASMSLRQAAKTAGAVILEPVMKVSIVCPTENLGDVMGHISARRGEIQKQDNHGNNIEITSLIPLAEMFGYTTTLRSATKGRGTFQMFFDHYAAVPKKVQEQIIKNSGKEKEK